MLLFKVKCPTQRPKTTYIFFFLPLSSLGPHILPCLDPKRMFSARYHQPQRGSRFVCLSLTRFLTFCLDSTSIKLNVALMVSIFKDTFPLFQRQLSFLPCEVIFLICLLWRVIFLLTCAKEGRLYVLSDLMFWEKHLGSVSLIELWPSFDSFCLWVRLKFCCSLQNLPKKKNCAVNLEISFLEKFFFVTLDVDRVLRWFTNWTLGRARLGSLEAEQFFKNSEQVDNFH